MKEWNDERKEGTTKIREFQIVWEREKKEFKRERERQRPIGSF
jgi:hypothetical protein